MLSLPILSNAGMKIELINIGTELILGKVLNTHHKWMAEQLGNSGYRISHQECINDTPEDIAFSIKSAISRADIILTTGGLGPTSDDLTRDVVADLFSLSLFQDSKVLENIRGFFEVKKRSMPDGVEIQAQVPEGAEVIHNQFGTAPGLIIKQENNPDKKCCLIMLPGPPRELHPMFKNSILPWLRKSFPIDNPPYCRIIRTTGMGESQVEKRIAPSLIHLIETGNLDVGYCARPGNVDIRLESRGQSAAQLLNSAYESVARLMAEFIYGEEETLLEEKVVELLTKTGHSVVLAESCTGGRISDRLTNVPGASQVVWGAFTTYSNESKIECLNVSPSTLDQFGAVSSQTAIEMAEGALKKSRADYAVSVTGIAGPGGGSDEKPVGTVFLALACKNKPTQVHNRINDFDRETFKYVTSTLALDLLRKVIGS